MTDLKLEWVVPEREGAVVNQLLESMGGHSESPRLWTPGAEEPDDEGDMAFDPLVLITASFAAAALLKAVSSIALDHLYPGGDLFDLRSGRLRRRPIPTLPRGTIVIVTDTGTEKFEPTRRDDGLLALDRCMKRLVGA